MVEHGGFGTYQITRFKHLRTPPKNTLEDLGLADGGEVALDGRLGCILRVSGGKADRNNGGASREPVYPSANVVFCMKEMVGNRRRRLYRRFLRLRRVQMRNAQPRRNKEISCDSRTRESSSYGGRHFVFGGFYSCSHTRRVGEC